MYGELDRDQQYIFCLEMYGELDKDQQYRFFLEKYGELDMDQQYINVVSSNPAHGEVCSIQHYLIKFVSDLR
jgi:hypothetical protein